MKEHKKLISTKTHEFTYIEPAKNVVVDELEEVFAAVQTEVGANVGFTEGHLIAELLQSIVD